MTKKTRVVSVAVSEAYPPRTPEKSCGVVQVLLGDGREFSLLAATPSWFEGAVAELGLPYYYGHSVLFLSRLELGLARKAVKAMALGGDRWFCLYDTPRRTLPQILADFKARHVAPIL